MTFQESIMTGVHKEPHTQWGVALGPLKIVLVAQAIDAASGRIVHSLRLARLPYKTRSDGLTDFYSAKQEGQFLANYTTRILPSSMIYEYNNIVLGAIIMRRNFNRI